MIQEKDNDVKIMLDCFKALGYQEEQLTIVEDYLEGRISEEELDNTAYTGFSGWKSAISQFREVMYGFIAQKKDKEVVQLFNAAFALNRANSYELLAWHRLDTPEGGLSKIASPKVCATYVAQIMAENQMWITKGQLIRLKSYARKNPQNLIEAMKYDSDKLVLFTCYFFMKYPDNTDSKKELPKRFTEQGLDCVDMEQNDRELLREYEELMLSSIESSFKNMDDNEKKELIESIRNNSFSDEMKSKIKQNKMDDGLAGFLGGCAFVNLGLSPILKTVVWLCLFSNAKNALQEIWNIDVRGDFSRYGGEFDELFDIVPTDLIALAVKVRARNVLKRQFEKNKESFLEVLNKVDYESLEFLYSIIKEVDKSMYEQVADRGEELAKERVISTLVNKNTAFDPVAKAYLRGEEPIEKLCADLDGVREGYYSYENHLEQEALHIFCTNYEDEAFYRRCMSYLLLRSAILFFVKMIKQEKEVVKQLFDAFYQEKMPFIHQLNGCIMIADSYYFSGEERSDFLDAAKEVFAEHLKKNRKPMVEAFLNTDAQGRCLGLMTYQKDAEAYKEEIFAYTKDSSKNVKEKLIEILKSHANWSEDVIKLLDSSKAAERELAVRVLQIWNKPEHREALKNTLEKEKSEKIRSQIMSALNMEESEGNSSISKEELIKQALKGNKKRTLAWAYETPFSTVHKKDKSLAEEEYLQAILGFYAAMSPCGISKEAALLAEELDTMEFDVYVNELFDKWLEAGAEAKKRWVLYAASIHGGIDIIKKLQHHIQEWSKNARGAIAGDAVQAMALSPQPQALLIVDGIARKFKHKQVKAAASKALDFAAAELGLTRAQLEDKIVPDLGFNEKMERVFDYGERKFTVTITTALELEIVGDNGKKVKSLPAPGQKDDEQKAAAAYAEYKAMKSQLKTVVSSQKERLEAALSSARQWTSTEWQALFVKNPIMHQFAIGLIWGVYEGAQLTQSFRYMEDGSFNTAQEEEYDIPDNAKVGLVHPIELSDQEKAAWTEQLEDYEIKQPFTQLRRESYVITEEEKGEKCLERFGGYVVNALSLSGKLQKYGWYKGSVLDAGGFYEFYREDPDLGIGAELHFSGTYVSVLDEDVTLYEVVFYKAGTVERGSYVYDEVEDKNTLFLEEVPERYFSEIVLQLSEITQKSEERNKEWKKNRYR